MAKKGKSAKGRKPASKAYAEAGVDIDLGDRLKSGLVGMLKSARRPEMIGNVGGFGGLFDLSRSKVKEPVLVSSVDSVGTKVKLAFTTGKHQVVGQDIVNHCANDIAVMGAEPLFFLDYLGVGKLEAHVFRGLLAGMARACAAANCALIGGETAQLPGLYQVGEYDLVGCIVGLVEKKRIITGAAIRPGDVLLGLASSGLHTNGYSLAQKIAFDQLGMKLTDPLPGSRGTLEAALLKVHVNYAPMLLDLLRRHNGGPSRLRKGNAVHGLCHITGGGFPGNLPRILPENCAVQIDTTAWPKPPIFRFLAERGDVAFAELYEVFNMGIGMVLVVDPDAADRIKSDCRRAGHRAFTIGRVTRGPQTVELER